MKMDRGQLADLRQIIVNIHFGAIYCPNNSNHEEKIANTGLIACQDTGVLRTKFSYL